jgi:hypothetical protein
MRRCISLLVVLGCVLGFATASRAGVFIDFEVAGSNILTSAPSSSITVDIYLTVTGATSLTGYQFSITYQGVSGAHDLYNHPDPIAPFSASWVSGGTGLALDNGDGVIGAAISASTQNSPADDITAPDGPVWIGSIVFHIDTFNVVGDVVGGCFNCDAFFTQDAISGSGDLTTTFHGLVVPEPTTPSLLVLGCLGFAAGGRARARRPRG